MSVHWRGAALAAVVLLAIGSLRPALAETPMPPAQPAIPADQVPPEVFEAIEKYVDANLDEYPYLGYCDELQSDAGPGWCSGVVQLTETTARVGIGIFRTDTFADPISLERQPDGSWEVVSVGLVPPDTGTGFERSSGDMNWLFVGTLLAITGAVTALVALRRT